tara:strand:+ start:82 stop:771 length:690 start_codon:yes stop_codon:yes gene_type:complete
MVKYYAVKSGKVPGIYLSWSECETQVKGFSGAVYKSFTSKKEAEEFISGKKSVSIEKKKEETDFLSDPNTIEIYSDGSHFKHSAEQYLGIGVFALYLGEEYRLSDHCDSELLKEYGIENSKISNPTCEFLAFAETLKFLYLYNLSQKYTFIFKIDYVGVANWMQGTWKCKEPYIQKIKTLCDTYIRKIKCKIVIQHVSGHSGNYGNDEADKMAKCQEKINTLELLLEKL